jgi:ATP phosphoribosyltransferase regulatory subunit
MKRSSLGLKLPEGMRDLLPDELARLEDFERQALTVCYNWAYQKVLTPGLEYRACVEPDADKDDNLYKLFDKKGRILVLRPEFTTPIARLVANSKRRRLFRRGIVTAVMFIEMIPTVLKNFASSG